MHNQAIEVYQPNETPQGIIAYQVIQALSRPRPMQRTYNDQEPASGPVIERKPQRAFTEDMRLAWLALMHR